MVAFHLLLLLSFYSQPSLERTTSNLSTGLPECARVSRDEQMESDRFSAPVPVWAQVLGPEFLKALPYLLLTAGFAGEFLLIERR